MSQFALRVKTKSGHQVLNLKPESTILDLKVQLSKLCDIPINRLHVLSGFPPKVFDLSGDNVALQSSGLSSGDTLIIEEKAAPVEKKKEVVEEPRIHTADEMAAPGILMKKIVPADNSCLFSSIYFALNGKVDESGSFAPDIRRLIAETISKDTETFSEAMLGKPNSDYCKWIQDDKSWGGAIELMVLSEYFGFEIAVVDTTNAIINRFGEDKHYPHRVFLMFDGIHYDPLYLEPFDGSQIQTIFPSEDERILQEAQTLAHEANSSRQFTDMNKFTLKCQDCNIYLKGEKQAREHAQSTGHQNFGEVVNNN